MTFVKYNTSSLNKLVAGLRSIPKATERAATRAINRTLITARNEITGNVREDYNVKAGAFKKGLEIRKANFSNLEGRLSAEGSPGVNLIEFQAKTRISPGRIPSTRWSGNRPNKIPQPRVGVSGMVSRRTGIRTWPGAFVARLRSGHVGVFRRMDGRRTRAGSRPAIRELYGPSAVRILRGGRYTRNIETLVNETMPKNMRHETRNILRRLGR